MNAGTDIPTCGGTYALRLRLGRPITIRVGALGLYRLLPMDYVYIGSAHGPGGLRSRVNRHRSHSKKVHWHIDNLTKYADIITVWYTDCPARLECAWNQALGVIEGVTRPIPHFGASDCTNHCTAHLLGLSQATDQDRLLDFLRRASPGCTVYIQR